MKSAWVRAYGICVHAQNQNIHQNISIHQLKRSMKTVGQEVRRKQPSTKWSKLEDKQLADPISHLIAKGDSGGGEVTHCFGLDDPARRMTCIAISTRRVTVKKHLSYETRWTWQRLCKTIPDDPEVMFFHCACAWEPDAAAVTEAMVLHSAWMLPCRLALRLGAAKSPVVLPVGKHRSRLPLLQSARLRSRDRT